jgi:hypothetical protein
MDPNLLLYVMTAFVIVSAIALCIQAAMLSGMNKATKTLLAKVEPLVPKLEAVLPKLQILMESTRATMESTKATVESTRVTVELGKKHMIDIAAQAGEILASTKHQLAMVEDVVTQATSRAKVQMERVELVLDDTVSRAHETVALVHTGVMRPLRELHGLAAGIRTAMAHLSRGTRPSVAQATSDEEMFI